MGNSVIPGSKNPQHIQDNHHLYDFHLTQEEMEEIAALDTNKHYYTQTQELLDKYLQTRPDFDKQEEK